MFLRGQTSKWGQTPILPLFYPYSDLYFRRIAKVQVAGKSEAVTVYEPMTKFASEVRKEELELFAKGLQLFDEEKIIEAQKILNQI